MRVKEADKLTLGQELTVPNHPALCRGPPEGDPREVDIQSPKKALPSTFPGPPCIQFCKTSAINPASLLPDDNPAESLHDCLEVTDVVQSTRVERTDVLLQEVEEVVYTDGRSFVQDGIRCAGAATVTLDSVGLVPQLRDFSTKG